MNYRISGNIHVIDGSSISANVYFSAKSSLPSQEELAQINRTSTFKGGYFSTTYQAIANSPIYLFIFQENYLPVRHTIHTSVGDSNLKIDAKILVAGKIAPPRPEFKFGSEQEPTLQTFTDACGGSPSTSIPQSEIYFIETVEKVSAKEACIAISDELVRATLITKRGKMENIIIGNRVILADDLGVDEKELAENN